MPADLLSPEDARARLLRDTPRLPVCDTPLANAAGAYLAADLVARLTRPAKPLSAMDGYALRFADLGRPLRVVGVAAAGAPWSGTLPAGAAVRIFTGAIVPDGADTIAVQEDAVVTGDTVTFPNGGPLHKGAYIRPAGADFRTGTRLAAAGTRVTPRLIGLAAAAGFGTLPVRRRPRVAILATGDELVPAGPPPSDAQAVNANSPMLAALLARAGAEVTDLGIVRDEATALRQAIGRARAADILVTSGGASVGDRDLVRPVLQEIGADLAFWRLALRPGKPLMAGALSTTRILGLPGNPVSAFVCAVLFLLPLLRHMQGAADPLPTPVYRHTTVALAANGARRHYMRAVVTARTVTPFPDQDSAMLGVLAEANALLVRPAAAPAVPVGGLVRVLPL